MANDEFYGDQIPDEPIIEKIKVGEKEYSQDELQHLVELGSIGVEAESKYKTKIDRVWPQFQSIVNEKRELEERLRVQEEQKTQAQYQQNQNPNQPLTESQIRDAALKQAEELGIGPQSVRKTIIEVMQGQRLLDDISSTIDNMTGEGLPNTTTEDLIAHMQETGIRNPEKAYKDMFEKEWISNQTEKLSQIKRTGMPTISASTAGSKAPAPVRVTNDNLNELLAQAIAGNQ